MLPRHVNSVSKACVTRVLRVSTAHVQGMRYEGAEGMHPRRVNRACPRCVDSVRPRGAFDVTRELRALIACIRGMSMAHV